LTVSGELSTAFLLALTLLSLPLISAGVSFLINEKFSWLAPITSSLFMLASFILSILLFLVSESEIGTALNFDWFTINGKLIKVGFLLDRNSLLMGLVVSFVSILVHIFSIGYMADDKNVVRYFGMLGFFTFAMLGLVMSSNLLALFFFWELVGFSSYRLVGHWHEKGAAASASTKAFLINKTGDLSFLIGLMMLWSASGNLELISLSQISSPWLSAAGICLFIGIMAKSAQFPFYNWLPDAMEGPTPVSALIHAATMVAAGVFLLIRIEPIFTNESLIFITVIGTITAILGAIGALFQYDIKRILAYSTISQLGFMVMAIGAGSTEGGFLHLLHHAFFKAGLFLGAGSIIHAMHQAQHHDHNSMDVQDIRNLGALRKKLPITFLGFVVCAAALAGLPLTSGFISKEMILSDMSIWAGSAFSWKWFILLATWSVTVLTPLYIFRLVWFTFFATTKTELQPQEVPIIMRIPVIALAIGSVTFLFASTSWSLTSLVSKLSSFAPHADNTITFVSIFLILLSLIAGYFIYRKGQSHTLLNPQGYLDWSNTVVVKFTFLLSSVTAKLDTKWIDGFVHGVSYVGVTLAYVTGWSDRKLLDGLINGTASAAKGIGDLTRSIANGKIQSYLLWAMTGLIIFILWILY
jgi:NADH-quinone oxidoreductase subunit L